MILNSANKTCIEKHKKNSSIVLTLEFKYGADGGTRTHTGIPKAF